MLLTFMLFCGSCSKVPLFVGLQFVLLVWTFILKSVFKRGPLFGYKTLLKKKEKK